MKRLIGAAFALVLVSACHRDSDQLTRKNDPTYGVVQEGAASGATATVGDVSTPPMTNTSVDTTTNFTLNPAAVNAAAPQGSVASTIPTTTGGVSMPSVPPSPAATAAPRQAGVTPTRVERPTAAQAPVITNVPASPVRTTRTTPRTPSPAQTSAAPATDTTTTPAPPPATTSTPAPQPEPKPQAPKTDTQPPPAQPQPDDNPPPTATDTRGTGR